MLIDPSAEGAGSSGAPVQIVEIQKYQGRQSETSHVIYKADSGWYFLKSDIDKGGALRSFAGLSELQQEVGEPLRLLVRHQVLRNEANGKPVGLKKIFSRS